MCTRVFHDETKKGVGGGGHSFSVAPALNEITSHWWKTCKEFSILLPL